MSNPPGPQPESESEEYVEETNTGFYSTAVECAI